MNPESFLIPARVFAFIAIMCAVYLVACGLNALGARAAAALREYRDERHRRNWNAILKKL